MTDTDTTTVPSRPAGANDEPTGWSLEEHELLNAKGVNDDPAGRALLFYEAQRSGLNPLADQLYLSSKWVEAHKEEQCNDLEFHAGHGRWEHRIMTAIDGFRLVASRQAAYGGQTATQWCGRDGVWHDVYLADGPPFAARVGVYVERWREPAWGVAKFDSYNAGSWTWRKLPDVMTAKCAEALAIRKAFPDKLSGIYTSEELAQAKAEEDRKVAEVFNRTAEAARIYALAEVATTRQEHAELWKEARRHERGSLLSVYLSKTSSTLADALVSLAKASAKASQASLSVEDPDASAQPSQGPAQPSGEAFPTLRCEGCQGEVSPEEAAATLWNGHVWCSECGPSSPEEAEREADDADEEPEAGEPWHGQETQPAEALMPEPAPAVRSHGPEPEPGKARKRPAPRAKSPDGH